MSATVYSGRPSTQIPTRREAMSFTSRLRRLAFGINLKEVTLARRGFIAKSQAARQRLEQIGETFVQGYHAALEEHRPDQLAARLQNVDREFRGFAFEGAAMALFLFDCITPWRRDRWQRFLEGPGNTHAYMVHVGAGWVLGRLPINAQRAIASMDPLLRWLAIDGYAFHEAFFRTQWAVRDGAYPRQLRGYARRAWDTGIGRALWFVEGTDEDRVAARIAGFALDRQADLWSGVGLACAYAGGAEENEIRGLMDAARQYQPHFAQGVIFAAKARERADNIAPHTEAACQVVWSLSAKQSAGISDEQLSGAFDEGVVPAYEVWRKKIQQLYVGK